MCIRDRTYAPQQLKGWSFTVSGAMDRGSMLGNNYGGMLVIRKPVSYTHLDVYKRQPIPRMLPKFPPSSGWAPV